jgi:hypothetical protein
VTSSKSAPSVSLSRSCVGNSCVVVTDIVSPKEEPEEEQVSEKLFRLTYTFIPVGWGEKGRGVKGPMCESVCVCVWEDDEGVEREKNTHSISRMLSRGW